MKIKTNKTLVKEYYEELWNKQNKEYIDILFHEDIEFHGSLNIDTKGKKEFEEYMDKVLTGIPNLYHGIETMVEENNCIAVKAVYNGTHKGQLFEFEASNNRIKYNGASFFKFEDNKIISIWVLGDLTALYKQLKK
ncbi:MAG: ester cyclase [Halarcobacter ebronensis]|uniref:ester cyclase n=1 Tax=Halarcobacter ebronensis TaxID=1462615 RepID=UPI003C7332CA